jgi:hypothetical protein
MLDCAICWMQESGYQESAAHDVSLVITSIVDSKAQRISKGHTDRISRSSLVLLSPR